jgi:hypothetical protein
MAALALSDEDTVSRAVTPASVHEAMKEMD